MKLNIQVDLEQNEVLTKEIDEAIVAAVKHRAREVWSATLESEAQRLADGTLSKWTKNGYNGRNRLESLISSAIETKLQKDVEKRTDEINAAMRTYLSELTSKIDSSLERRMDGMGIEKYVQHEITDAVKNTYPEQIMELIKTKEMNDMRSEMQELRKEIQGLRE